MAQAHSISLTTLQAAVKAAVSEHPKFNLETPHEVTTLSLVTGFAIPQSLAAKVTLGEAQAFADAVAEHIVTSQPEVRDVTAQKTKGQGTVLSVGRHVVCGIPPVSSAT
ncbi:MAG: hypothetical protein WAL71_21050 [Terriglobales bacterium]|jgi:DNA primase